MNRNIAETASESDRLFPRTMRSPETIALSAVSGPICGIYSKMAVCSYVAFTLAIGGRAGLRSCCIVEISGRSAAQMLTALTSGSRGRVRGWSHFGRG